MAENPWHPQTQPQAWARWEADQASLENEDTREEWESARRVDAGLHPQTDNPVGLAPTQVTSQTADSTGQRATPIRPSGGLLSESSKTDEDVVGTLPATTNPDFPPGAPDPHGADPRPEPSEFDGPDAAPAHPNQAEILGLPTEEAAADVEQNGEGGVETGAQDDTPTVTPAPGQDTGEVEHAPAEPGALPSADDEPSDAG